MLLKFLLCWPTGHLHPIGQIEIHCITLIEPAEPPRNAAEMYLSGYDTLTDTMPPSAPG